MNARMRPSGDRAGETTESVKLVICWYITSSLDGLRRVRRSTGIIPIAGTAMAAIRVFRAARPWLYRQRTGPARKLRYRPRNWRRKNIAAASHRANHLLRIVAQSAADVEQALRQGIVAHCRVRPNGVDQRGLCH